MFLLVVLGGGAGLLVVWSVHPGSRPRLAGRPGPRSLRATPTEDTTRDTSAEPANGAPVPSQERPAPLDERPAGAEPVPASPATLLEVVEAPAAPERVTAPVDATPPAGPARRGRRGRIPAAFTAVEGSYRDVAVVPLWRKGLSLVLLLLLLLLVSLALAAVTGAVLGVAAELVDGAIG